jgi:hypothetical protein
MTSFPGLYVTSLNVKYNFHAGGTWRTWSSPARIWREENSL